MKKREPLQPRIPRILSDEIILPEDEGFYQQLLLADQDFSYLEIDQLCFQQSHIKKTKLLNMRLTKFECMDVQFENCDLSNVEWIAGSFHRVIFKNCKLTGSNFAESVLHDCQFIDCVCNYTSFNYAQLKIVHFQETSLLEAEFSEIKWTYLTLDKSNLTGTTWFHTLLNGLDFSHCSFEKIAFSQETIRGLTVNQEQAIVLALGLGIILAD